MPLVAMWSVMYCGFHPAFNSPTSLVGHVTGDMKQCESNETLSLIGVRFSGVSVKQGSTVLKFKILWHITVKQYFEHLQFDSIILTSFGTLPYTAYQYL